MRPAVLFLAALCGFSAASSALACSCGCPDATTADYLDDYALVFEGTPIRSTLSPDGEYREVVLSVDRIWRGAAGEEVRVRTPAGGEMACEATFYRGISQRVWAVRGDDGELRTSLCSGMCYAERLIGQGIDDLASE